MGISNLRRTKRTEKGRMASSATTRPFTYNEVKVIKQIAAKPEETKQYQFAYGSNISHAVGNAYELSYQQIFAGISRGTAADDVVGNQIRVKGIRIDCMVRSLSTATTSGSVFGKIALVRANYQLTPYTTDQMLKPPDANTLAVATYNQHTRPWNVFNGCVKKVYSNKDVKAVKQFITAGDGIWKKTWYVDMKNELIKFASGSTLEQRNDDLYLFWILSGMNVGSGVATVGEMQFNFTVYYKDA